jgi:hypothetical protein
MESRIGKREGLAVFMVALLTASLLLAPYVVGHLNARPDTDFTGLLVNIEDGTYLSAIEQGRLGAWTYRSHFTVETHEPVFLEGFYLMLGHAARLTGLSTVAIWHVGLFFADLLLFLTIYGFIAFIIQSPGQRFAAYFLALFGAGFDWVRFPDWFERQRALEAVPIDFRVPEAHVFYSALTFPHFVAGIILILLTFGLTLYLLLLPANEKKRRWFAATGAGTANLLLGIVYPFLIYLSAAVIGSFYFYLIWTRSSSKRRGRPDHNKWWRAIGQAISWHEVGMLLLIFMIPLPLFLYYGVVFLQSSVLRTWSEQAVTLSPNPIHYLLTYGLYLFLGSLTFKQTVERKAFSSGSNEVIDLKSDVQAKLLFLWVWIGAAAILLYIPLNSQRRYVEGLQVPLAILAVIGFFTVGWPWLLRTRLIRALLQRPRYSPAGLQRLAIILLIGTASLTNIFLYASTLIKLIISQPYPLFRPELELEAMDWLEQQIEPGEVVLAAYWTGSYLPFRTGATVIVGNRYETGQFNSRRQQVEQFFSSATTDEWRQGMLAQYGVQYIFVGPGEKRLGNFWEMDATYLQILFENEAVVIYKVQEG